MASSILLSDNGASSGSAGLKSTAGNDGVLILQTTTSGGTATNALAIDTSQNVGIGTSSPNAKLEVTTSGNTTVARIANTGSSSDNRALLRFVSQTSTYGSGVFQTNGTDAAYAVNALNIYTFDSQPIAFGTNNSERARIDSSGNVSIGTTAASGKLNLYNTANAYFEIASNGRTLGTTSMLYGQDTGGSGYVWNRENSAITFGTNNTTRATLDNLGQWGYGGGAQTNIRQAVFGMGATSATYSLHCYTSNGFQTLAVRDDGLILTGTRSLSPYNCTTGSSPNMYVGSDGILYRSTSSLKYKDNVQNAAHGLAEVMLLRPVTYEGTSEADTGKTFGGLIAEEVHEAGLTEFVQYADDGTPDALAYGNMVSLCIKAIQEQQALITTLTERITALEGEQA